MARTRHTRKGVTRTHSRHNSGRLAKSVVRKHGGNK